MPPWQTAPASEANVQGCVREIENSLRLVLAWDAETKRDCQ